jgi:hypothetical protein
MARELHRGTSGQAAGNRTKKDTMKDFQLSIICVLLMVGCIPASADLVTGTYDPATAVGSQTTGTGPYTLTSTDTTFSLLRFIPNQTFTFADITNINVDYNAILGGIGGGAPRLAVVFVSGNSLEINFGPAGSFVDPTLGAGNSGNLISLLDLGRYDNSGVGGSFYSDYAQALSLAGGETVQRFTLVLDSFGGNDREFSVSAINVEANVGAVPEPSAITLLATAAGFVALAARRRRLAR